jgi:hypothetical protein
LPFAFSGAAGFSGAGAAFSGAAFSGAGAACSGAGAGAGTSAGFGVSAGLQPMVKATSNNNDKTNAKNLFINFHLLPRILNKYLKKIL